MNNQKFNLDTFKAKLASNQVLSSKDIQSLKGGTSEPPPFGNPYGRISEPPPFGW